MKVKTKRITAREALAIKTPERKLQKPSFLFRTLVRLLSIPALIATKFSHTKRRMKEAGKGPWLVLMNHSCFLDLKIASKLLYPKRYYIVSTSDALVGKAWLMKKIGCMPTPKFIADATLARNMLRAVREKKTSVLLFPEAGYSFDGRTTTLPSNLGGFIKKLGVPVVSVITDGAFLHQPLYNDLYTRKTKVTARMQCLLTKEELQEKTADELQAIVEKEFSFNAFQSQYENKVKIDEKFRAQGLHRILYRCPHCNAEGQMQGENETLACRACGKVYRLTEYGQMQAENGETEFSHIPDWYDWERECVRREIESGSYKLDLEVEIAILVDYKAVYKVGKGRLTHDSNGFKLQDESGAIDYTQSPLSSYSLNSDFNWYEMGDIICIGDRQRLYYCFPSQKDVVTKARFAAEEIYKLHKTKLKNP